MSDLDRDLAEEDEVRRLLSRPEQGLVTPAFVALGARRRGGTFHTSLLVAGVAAVVVFAVTVARDDQRAAAPVAPAASPPSQTASPAMVAIGTGRPVTPCPEIPMPAYLPFRDPTHRGSQRTASSQDIVSLTVPDLVVGGEAAELFVQAEASRPIWMITDQRQVGERAVTLTYTSGLAPTPAPPGRTPSLNLKNELRAEWFEPNGTCPYFTARLRSAGTDARTLEGELLRMIGSMPLTATMSSPSPSATWVVAPLIPEQEAWDRIAALFPTGPVAKPTWLPPQVERRGVLLRTLEVSPTRAYEVAYLDSSGTPILTFRLGTHLVGTQSGMGFCCVRAAPAVLEFDSHLFNDPARPGLRRVRWDEQTRTLSFASDRIRGEDMLRIAWELDRSTAPTNPYPDVRTKRGACAAADPEATVRRMLALYGSKDRAALFDCFALDRITTSGTPVASAADLPTVVDVSAQRRSEIAGRVEIQATWTFTSDPGGAFNRRHTQFFLLGLEEGLWRIYDGGTAPFGRPP